MRYKYPIGTKVIYNPRYPIDNANRKYRYQIATLIKGLSSIICLFEDGKKIVTIDESVSLIKNQQQLLFSFMSEATM